MSTHPTYYTSLLLRRIADDPTLTPTECLELDLHLSICPVCTFTWAQLLRPVAPRTAEALLRDLENRLSFDLIAPYLRELAQATQASVPLSNFQLLLWRVICRDREALGRFRLLEAQVHWRSRR